MSPKLIHPRKINRIWFEDQIKRRKISKRGLAKLMGVSPSIVAHTLSGRRRMPVEEAKLWADALACDFVDVASNSGLNREGIFLTRNEDVGNPLKAQIGEVQIVGTVLPDLSVRVGGVVGPQKAPNPLFNGVGPLVEDLEALRLQTAGGPFSSLDGGLFFYRKLTLNVIDPESFERPSVVQLKGGEIRVRILKRGFEAGLHNLASFSGETLPNEVGVQIVAANPISVIKL